MHRHEELSNNEIHFIKFIGHQLQRSERKKINLYQTGYEMESCTINNGDPISFQDTIALVPGFGSGWRGISLLGYELAKRGHQVTMISLLGYGNSDNPPNFCRADFKEEAISLSEWAKGRAYHWVVHSMAAPILVELACLNPNCVSSLTMLDPVGFHNRSKISLGLSFANNGWAHHRKFKGNAKWQLFENFLPKEKSAFTPDRLRYRWREWENLCNDAALVSLKKVLYKKRVACFFGDNDSLYKEIDCHGLMEIPLRGLYHNTTMFGSELTADAIDSFVFDLIK